MFYPLYWGNYTRNNCSNKNNHNNNSSCIWCSCFSLFHPRFRFIFKRFGFFWIGDPCGENIYTPHRRTPEGSGLKPRTFSLRCNSANQCNTLPLELLVVLFHTVIEVKLKPSLMFYWWISLEVWTFSILNQFSALADTTGPDVCGWRDCCSSL